MFNIFMNWKCLNQIRKRRREAIMPVAALVKIAIGLAMMAYGAPAVFNF